jgi:hypothetical protein
MRKRRRKMIKNSSGRKIPLDEGIMKKVSRKFPIKRTVQLFTLVVLLVFAVTACKSPHPEIQYFARDLAKDLKINVCDGNDIVHEPCGQRNVLFHIGGLGVIYIDIYGVTDKKEIERLVDYVKKYRGEEYKAIPLKIVFYADLAESKIVYEEKIKGEK